MLKISQVHDDVQVLAAVALLTVLGLSLSLAETFDARRAVIINGDTVAFGSERVRILNIDAPETRGSQCERELVMGLRAKERLATCCEPGLWRSSAMARTAIGAPSPGSLCVARTWARSSSERDSLFLGRMDRKPRRPGAGIGAGEHGRASESRIFRTGR